MKRRRISVETPRRSSTRSVHISEYIAILREHKWVALVPFLLLLGGAVTLTLLAEPVYQAEALIEIEADAGGAGLLGEFQLADTAAKVDAEMVIMQSRLVAAGAAMRLTEPRPADLETMSDAELRETEFRRMSDFLIEVNRHRPLEVMLSAFGYTKLRCGVELECSPLPGRRAAELFDFCFLGETEEGGGYTLEVHKVKRRRFGSDRETTLVEIRSGEPFTVFDRTFQLTVDGDPAGRVYSVTLRNREDIANWLRAHTIVSQLGRNTGIVALGCKSETPRLAQAAARALAHSFDHTKTRQKRDDAGQAVDFLKEREDAVKDELARAEKELDAFQKEHGVTFLSEKAKALIDRISLLDLEVAELELRLKSEERIAGKLRSSEDVTVFVRGDDPTATALVEQLTELQLQRAEMKGDVTTLHPLAESLDGRIKSARDRLGKHLVARADAALEATKQRSAHVDSELKRVHRLADVLPDQERQLASMTRKVASLVAIHNFLQEKKHEATITQASVFSNVRIIDDPVLPRTRTSPNLLVNVLVGLFLALLAALGTAFFAEYLDRSVKTPDELERALGLPLYAALPAFKSIRSRDIKKLKSAMVTIEKPSSVLSEGYRSLRANIRFADFESPVKSFAITSAVLGEGKTTTTLNLAVVLAQAGSKVIVVDCDLRRPATHTHLNGTLSPGVSDVLQGKADWRAVIRPVTGVENLDVLHGGDKPSNPGALFDSDNFTELLDDLKNEYEYVLCDVPPVLAVSDSASFFRRLDALFLLVQWRRCPVDVVLAAKEQAERLGATLRGVIFNGFDARKSARRGYGHYGYYGYYGYYGKYRGYGYGYGYVSDRERKKSDKPVEPSRQ